MSLGLDICRARNIGNMDIPRCYHTIIKSIKDPLVFIILGGNSTGGKEENAAFCMKYDKGTKLVK